MISMVTIIVLMLSETVRMETCVSVKQLPITELKSKAVVDIRKECGPGTKPCVIKCCPENEVLFKIPKKPNGYTCRNTKLLSMEYNLTAIKDDLSDYSNIITTDSDKRVSFFEDFRILYSDRFVQKPCSLLIWDAFLNENGTAKFNENMVEAITPDFCADMLVGLIADGSVHYIPGFYFRLDDHISYVHRTTFLAYGGLVSAFFMFLVLIVHSLLKFLHGNPKGKLLMGFLSCMMLYFMYQAWYFINMLKTVEGPISSEYPLPACKWVSPIGYFLFLSAFFWLNAMCYDIWRKFRSSKLKSQDDKKKMCIYSAYALGTPLLITVIAVLIDQYGTEGVRPGFDYCLEDDNNDYYIWKRLYIGLPTGLIVLANVVMWALTMRNVRRLRFPSTARSARKDSAYTTRDNILSNAYKKLFILMGVTWLIDVAASPFPRFEDWTYFLVTVPNTLLGVLIFFVTVFQKNIFIMLCKRFGIENKWTLEHMNRTQVSQMPSTYKSKASS